MAHKVLPLHNYSLSPIDINKLISKLNVLYFLYLEQVTNLAFLVKSSSNIIGLRNIYSV